MGGIANASICGMCGVAKNASIDHLYCTTVELCGPLALHALLAIDILRMQPTYQSRPNASTEGAGGELPTVPRALSIDVQESKPATESRIDRSVEDNPSF